MSKKKLSLRALVLMVFTSVFGFTNVTRSYYLMGYAAIPWFIISCVTFFLPFAFMIAEYGSAFKDSEGGIYSWMEKSSGGKYAFMVTFMWYASYIVWMVNVGSGIWIVLSNAIFGVDKTQSWSLFGLDSVKTLGILAILWIIILTFISSKGVDKIKKFTSFGGSAVALINVFLFVGGILMLLLNKGGVGDPITVNALAHSPNPAYAGGLQVLSFIVYAIFAYGGLEVVGGLVDQTENPEKNFPKGIIISAVVVALFVLLEWHMVSPWVLLVIVAREFLVSGLRMVVSSKGVVIAASDLGKWKTATTMVAICGLLFVPSIPGGMIQDVLLFIFNASMWAAVVLTAWSGIRVIFSPYRFSSSMTRGRSGLQCC